MTNTHAAATAASHATATELALASLYHYARETVRTGRNAATAADLPAWFAREDEVGRSIGYLARTTQSDIGLIFEIAKELR
jgi:hypothetical protein